MLWLACYTFVNTDNSILQILFDISFNIKLLSKIKYNTNFTFIVHIEKWKPASKILQIAVS